MRAMPQRCGEVPHEKEALYLVSSTALFVRTYGSSVTHCVNGKGISLLSVCYVT